MLTAKKRKLLAVHLQTLACAAIHLDRIKSRRKKWWVHPAWQNRNLFGSYRTLVKSLEMEDPEYLRMSSAEFAKLKTKLKPFLKKQPAGRPAVSVGHRLALTIRFLASGDSMASIAFSFRVGFSTVSLVVREVSDAQWKALVREYLPVPTTEKWENLATELYRRWQFPNCIGAADGKHVQIQCPWKSGSKYYNYKNYFSIVLMAVVDSNYKFIAVDIGGYGSNSDGGIWKSSKFGRAFDKGEIPIPPPKCLPGSEIMTPHVLLGDEAFQLRSNFMRPYPGRSLDEQRRIYNYRLSRARRCVENGFGILAAKWRIFRRPINLKPQNVDRVVKSFIVLHNFLKTEAENTGSTAYYPPGYGDRYEDGQFFEGEWRNEVDLTVSAFADLTASSNRNYTQDVNAIRESFAEYFSSVGSVPWQSEATGINAIYL